MVVLKPMTEEEFQRYIVNAIEEYANDKIASGNWRKDEAVELSRQSFTQLLPEDEKTASNYLFSILHDQQVIGMIWLAQKSSENLVEGFIYDFLITEHVQGRGYGKQAMKELEVIAKELGMQKIGLHVFGHNNVARGLYEKMGYEITNITMSKSI